MNNILRILGTYGRQLRNAAMAVAVWERGQFQAILDGLIILLQFNTVIMTLGLVIGRIATTEHFNAQPDSASLMVADFLISLAGVVSSFMSLYLLVRVAIITVVTQKLAGIMAKVLETVTRPLPSTPITIANPISEDDAKNVIKTVAAGFAALTGGCAYAALFPVYTNLTGFFITITLIFFAIYMVIAFDLPSRFPWKSWLVYGAVLVVIVQSLILVIPGLGSYLRFQTASISRSWEQKRNLYKAKDTADQTVKDSLEVAIVTLQQKRAALQAKLEVNGSLTQEELRQFTELTKRINDNASAALLDAKPETKRDYRNPFGNFSWSWPVVIIAGILLIAGIMTGNIGGK